MKKVVILFILFNILFSFTHTLSVNAANCTGQCCQIGECVGSQITGYDVWCPGSTVCCQSCKSGTSLGPIGGDDSSFGPWGGLGSGSLSDATGAFTKILSNIIGVMTIIAGLWFMFQFIISGYAYMSAGEDPQRMGNATKKITSSLIGLVIVVAAYAIISLIGSMLGFEILNPQNIITKLGPN